VAEPKNVFEQALKIADALHEREIPYAIGGALAYGIWSEARATKDIDLNVFVSIEGLDSTFAALRAAEVAFEDSRARRDAAEQGMFLGQVGEYRVDVFVPSIDFSWEAHRTASELVVRGRPYRFLSAEALAVFKLLFFRPKDVLDLEKLVAVLGKSFDAAYVRRHIVEMMGEDDERVRTWDRIVAEFATA
jgi:hypothetical protein